MGQCLTKCIALPEDVCLFSTIYIWCLITACMPGSRHWLPSSVTNGHTHIHTHTFIHREIHTHTTYDIPSHGKRHIQNSNFKYITKNQIDI